MFNDFRRSTAMIQLALIHSQGLLTAEDMARFSSEAQDYLKLLRGIDQL